MRNNFGKNKFMAYFNYHVIAQKLIKTGHCVKAELVDKYKDICPALILSFDNHIQMPIRFHKFEEYVQLLERHGIKVEKQNKDKT